MTITLTREEAQQVLDALADAAGCVQENYQPGHMGHGWGKEIETLRARLSAPEPPCKTGSQCIGGKCPQCVVTEPVGWIYEDDEGRMMFSQMPKHPPLWEPVYRTAPKEKSDSKQTLQMALDALVKWQGICLAKSRSAKELTIPTKAIFALTAALSQGEPK
jgi:hypothetical protein